MRNFLWITSFLLWILCILLGLDETFFVWLYNFVKKAFCYQFYRPAKSWQIYWAATVCSTDPWTCSSSLISQFPPHLPDNRFSKQNQSEWSFLNVNNSYLTSAQDPPIGFHHIQNKTQTPYCSLRSFSYSRPCLPAQSPFILLPIHSLCSSYLHPISSGSRSFHFLCANMETWYILHINK